MILELIISFLTGFILSMWIYTGIKNNLVKDEPKTTTKVKNNIIK